MWAVRLIGSLSILAAGIICARSANDGVEGLESCFQAARLADGICSKLSNDPAKRLDCLQKTRAAQLECIEHVQSEPAPQKFFDVAVVWNAGHCCISREFHGGSFVKTNWRHRYIPTFD